MKKCGRLFFSILLFLVSYSVYATAYRIVPKPGTSLPTHMFSGQPVKAYYTITNITKRPLRNGHVKYLPPLVTQVTLGSTYPNTCSTRFNLVSGRSCTLELLVLGRVNAANPILSRHLFVCNPNVPACSGTRFPLNVTVLRKPHPRPRLVSLKVIPSSATILTGQTQQYRAMGTYSDGSVKNLTRSVVWSSSNPNLGTINNIGLATGISRTGSTPITIAATLGSVSGTATLNIKQLLAYVVNIASNTVSLCSVNQTTGALSGCITTGAGFNAPRGIAINPSNTFAYVVNSFNNTVSLCSVNQTTGELSACAATGSGFSLPQGIAINPFNTFAYVTNTSPGAGSVSLCSVNQTTGALSGCATTGSGFNTPSDIKLNASNMFAYVTSLNANSVSLCSVNQTTGVLSGCAPTGSGFDGPSSIAINPPNTFVYVGNDNTDTVSFCSVNQTTGALSGCTLTGSGFSSPVGVAISPTNTFAYVTNLDTNSVSLCSMNQTTGALSGCAPTGSGVPFVAPTGITIIAF